MTCAPRIALATLLIASGCAIGVGDAEPGASAGNDSSASSGGHGQGGLGGADGAREDCGNGVIDPGETCDDDCPTSCDDGDACTVDSTLGSAATCDLVCSHPLVVACEADGCCPATCDGLGDPDCAECGNYLVELGELCDGDCPTSCPTSKCTTATFTGSAQTCDSVCSYTPISACANGDGCCPPGCTPANDEDCGEQTLIVHSTTVVEAADVQQKLFATGAFAAVDVWNTANQGTPMLADLMFYQSALVFLNYGTDTATLGDVLASYDTAGGRVVLAPMANVDSTANPGGIGGAFQSGAYMLIATGAKLAGPASLVANVPSHPLLAGVTALSAGQAYRSAGAAASGATVVASWSTGEPLIVTAVVGWHHRVDVNFYPVSSAVVPTQYWIGDGANLLRNALLYQ